jgi:hypothetical protein
MAQKRRDFIKISSLSAAGLIFGSQYLTVVGSGVCRKKDLGALRTDELTPHSHILRGLLLEMRRMGATKTKMEKSRKECRQR